MQSGLRISIALHSAAGIKRESAQGKASPGSGESEAKHVYQRNEKKAESRPGQEGQPHL